MGLPSMKLYKSFTTVAGFITVPLYMDVSSYFIEYQLKSVFTLNFVHFQTVLTD